MSIYECLQQTLSLSENVRSIRQQLSKIKCFDGKYIVESSTVSTKRPAKPSRLPPHFLSPPSVLFDGQHVRYEKNIGLHLSEYKDLNMVYYTKNPKNSLSRIIQHNTTQHNYRVRGWISCGQNIFKSIPIFVASDFPLTVTCR